MSVSISTSKAIFLVRLADTAMILGQRLAELCSRGPYLEEDIALSNIGLDCFGRAEELYKMVAIIEGGKHSADDYAFLRNERQFVNLKLVEQPNSDFAWTMLRQFMHDEYMTAVFSQLLKSNDVELSGLSAKVLKEIRYSRIHAREWLLRLGLGTEESNRRLQNAVDHLMQFVPEIFAFDKTDREFLTDCDSITSVWNKEFNQLLSECNIALKEQKMVSQRDYREGFHSEHLGELLSIMQTLPRAYPDAKW